LFADGPFEAQFAEEPEPKEGGEREVEDGGHGEVRIQNLECRMT
jgi:hypothetical protein